MNRRELMWQLLSGLTLAACAPRLLPVNRTIPPKGAAPGGISSLAADTTRAANAEVKLVIDAHCHIFSARDLDIDAFLRGLVHADDLPEPVRSWVMFATGHIHRFVYSLGKPEAAKHLEYSQRALAMLPFEKWPKLVLLRDALEGLVRVADVPEKVFVELEKDCGQVHIFLPSMVDLEYWVKPRADLPRPLEPFDKQVDTIDKLAHKVNADPTSTKRILPLIAFNPLREIKKPGHLALVENAVLTRGFVGIKIYPPCGFSAAHNAGDPALGERVTYDGKNTSLGQALDTILATLYEFCIKNDVPLMAHANNSNSMRKGAGFLASPWGWRDVLTKHPTLRLNLAHFGHMEGASSVEGYGNSECVSWAKHIAQLMATHPNLYADVGYSGVMDASGKFQEKYVNYLGEMVTASEGTLPERLMYGSDWWMILLEGKGPSYYGIIEAWFTKNFPTWQNLWAVNAQRYLGLGEEGNKNRERIISHWGPALSGLVRTT